MFLRDLPLDPRTADNGNLIFHRSQFFTGQFGDHRRHPFLAGKAEIWRDIGIGHNSDGIPLTAGISASATLGKRKRFQDLFYQGIAFDCEFVGSNGKMRDDILSAREWLKDQGHGDRVGGLGLSLGGTLMLRTADSGWAAIAVFYPEVARAGPLARCCPVFARFGENDKRLPDAANSLRKCLQGGGQDFDLAEVSGAGHSYMSVGESAPVLLRPLTRHWGIKPNAHAAERTWHELVGFLCRYLGEVPTVPEPSVQPVLLRDSWTDRFRAGLRRWSGRTVDKKAMNSSKYPGGD